MNEKQTTGITRRQFTGLMGAAGAAWGLSGLAAPRRLGAAEPPVDAGGQVIPGFESAPTQPAPDGSWQPFSDRKIRATASRWWTWSTR